jgi:nicotinate dehydrogenase subunit B
MTASRRSFLKTGGALVVGFAAGPGPEPAAAQGAFGTHPSHIDPSKLDSWLAVGTDGAVAAYTGKCDFGQGIHTAQVQLIAEELCVSIDHITLIECDTALCPDQGTTSGSQSTPVNFNSHNLALAAATAREALLNMASRRLGVPPDRLTVSEGVVSGANARISYGELIGGQHFDLPLSSTARRISKDHWRVLGKPVLALDRAALMTGQFTFVHNMRVPGMLHGRVVRPPEMGASVASVDEGSVRGLPGMVKVIVRKDFVGVVAETEHQAVNAARQLSVRWHRGPGLPARQDFFAWMRQQPGRDALSVDSGDLDAELARAARVTRARYTYPYQMHGSLGSSCAVADVRENGATIWSATQSAYPTRSVLAKLLNLPLDSVRVIYVRGSGCYGLNGADAVSFDAATLSQAVGRPVRLQFSRQDEMMWENFGSACVIEQRAALAADGSIQAWDRESWAVSLGNRPGYDRPGNVISGMLLGYPPEAAEPRPASAPKGRLNNGSNSVPAYFAGCIDGTCGGDGTIKHERVLTHTIRSPFFTGPLRSPLRIQNTFANECFMDELCAEAGADPLTFRLKHLTDARLIGVLEAMAAAGGWSSRPSPQVTSARIASGRGIACVAYEGQNGYAALMAEVEVDRDSGLVQPRRFVVAVDCGPVSNPDGVRNQVEGGILQAISRALIEEVSWDDRRITSTDWETYPSLRLNYDVPLVECVFVEPANVPAAGVGETAVTVTPAAIGNAIFDAVGIRLRDVPFTAARVRAALRETASREQPT